MRRKSDYFLIWTCLCCAAYEHLHFSYPESIFSTRRALKAMDLIVHLAMHVLDKSIVLNWTKHDTAVIIVFFTELFEVKCKLGSRKIFFAVP